MSKLATILGLILGLIMVGTGIYDFESQQFIGAFLNPQAIAIVLGGSFAALLINYPFKQVSCVFHGFVKVFNSEPVTPDALVEELIGYSHLAKNKGVLALERQLDLVETSFLRYALSEMMIYKDKDQLKQKLVYRLLQTRLRHQSCQEVFENLASYAPAFGMLGTVMGLIMMMTSQLGGGDNYGADTTQLLSSLLTGMGLALVTTFYGVFFANFLFLPVAGKLKVLSDAEVLQNEMIIEAVIAIRDQESTLLVRERLLSYVNDYIEDEILQKAAQSNR